MRKQYHLRRSPAGLLAWDVDRLVRLTADLPREDVPLERIRELDEPFWFGGGNHDATCRAVADHARLILETDLQYPIILGADGRVMDGMHRVCRAHLEGRPTVLAVRLAVQPDPDFVGVEEDALPYPDEEPRADAPCPVSIRDYRHGDLPEWLRMRRALWPEIAPETEGVDAADWLGRPDALVLVAERPEGGLAGFAELAERPYADGCESGPVAYLEGWYVDPEARLSGVGAALVRAGEAWARARGYRELASDALLANTGSHRAHEAVGFVEVERAIRYRKSLDRETGGAEPPAAGATDRSRRA
jgi:GNAT superfamily N-acetyltransferase